MPTQVGLISSLQGSAIAVQSSGETLALAVNSPVFEGETIVVDGQNAEAVINTTQNQKITLSEGSTTLTQSVMAQVEQLQADILNNEDFDFNALEATAAGPQESKETPIEQSGFTSPVTIEPIQNNIELHSQTITNNQNTGYSVLSETNTTTEPSHEHTLNDPSLSNLGQSFSSITEDFHTALQGKIDTQAAFTANTQSTKFGNISYDDQGNWQYTLNNQQPTIQHLGAGDTLSENIQLTADNGGIFFIEITINGSNDQAIISGKKHDNVEAEPNGSIVDVSGKLDIQDIDTNEAGFVADNLIKTTYGSAEINTEGEWQYTLNNDLSSVQSLSNNNHLTDFFSVRALDGTSETIQITILGANDTPLLKGSNQAALNIDTNDTVSGHLEISDPDFGESHFQAVSQIDGNYGSGSIEENGQWTYQVDMSNPEVNSLDTNSLLYDTFIIATADGTEQTIIIPISNTPSTLSAASYTYDTNESQAIIELNDDDAILNPSPAAAENTTSSDLYIWNANQSEFDPDANIDSIAQFTLGENGDTLQLNDLLLESKADDQLDQFLHFSYDGQDTTIEISPHQDVSSHHFLVLNNTDLTAIGTTDNEIIHQLIQQGNLDIVGL